MYCRDCGAKLSLRFLENEGLIPYCERCGAFKFPYFPVAVSMTVVNRQENKILLARHTGEQDYKLFAGYIKKGETAEKAVTREFKEETKLNVVKYKYMSSRYHEPRNVLMFNYLVIAENGEICADADEIEECRWFTFDEALSAVRKNSVAEIFLKNAITEIKNNKI